VPHATASRAASARTTASFREVMIEQSISDRGDRFQRMCHFYGLLAVKALNGPKVPRECIIHVTPGSSIGKADGEGSSRAIWRAEMRHEGDRCER
jgi:hypothetical protein